ncbi:MAG: restriction endonuclease subunit S, partial [Nitrososphaeria archaeon]
MIFYKENEFKQEPTLGKVPKEWEVVRLKDVANYLNGYPFSPKDWKDKGLPIIRIQNLNNPDAEFNYFEGDIEDRYIVQDGDLLFSWSASIGAYIWNRGKAVLNQHIFKVIPKSNVDKLYLYYALFLAIEQLKHRIHGSTMKHFKKTELETKIPLPPYTEQRKIAEVLSVVDSAIELVDKIIWKTERLKKALMQTLLTRGIGHKEFKETEIGKIPKTWQIVKLGEIAEMKRGFSYRSSDLCKYITSYRFLTINDYEKEGGLKISAEPIYLREDIEIDN